MQLLNLNILIMQAAKVYIEWCTVHDVGSPFHGAFLRVLEALEMFWRY